MRIRAVATAALVALAVAGGCGPGPADLDSGPLLVVEPGLAPRLAPAAVAAIVLGQIRDAEGMVGGSLAPPRILRMTVTTSDRVSGIEPGSGDGLPQRPEGAPFIVWVVRSEGTFSTDRNRGPHPMTASSGYMVIADLDGSIVSYGGP